MQDGFPNVPLSVRNELVDTMIMRRKRVLLARLRHGEGIDWVRVYSMGLPVAFSQFAFGWFEAHMCPKIDDMDALLPPPPLEPIILKHIQLKQQSKGIETMRTDIDPTRLASIKASMSDQDWRDAASAMDQVEDIPGLCLCCMEPIPARVAADLREWRFVTRNPFHSACLICKHLNEPKIHTNVQGAHPRRP